MDRRVALLLGLGFGVLTATTGCTPSFFSKSPSTPQTPPITQTSQKQKEEDASALASAKENSKDKQTAKRKPRAETCVAYADFRLRESMMPGRTEQEIRTLREQARVSYQQALNLDPKCLNAHRGMAQLHSTNEDHERAIASYKGALNLLPKEASLWFELGMAHSRRKEWDLATQTLTRASDLDPNNKKYTNMVGFALARSGKYQESLVYFTRVVGEAKARYNIARMMLHVGQKEQGMQQLELALQLEPNLKDAQSLMAELEKSGKEVVPVQYQPE